MKNKKINPSILFIGKKNDYYCEKAEEFIRTNFSNCQIILGKRGDDFPEDAFLWKGNYIISYLSQWVIPKNILDRAQVASINFHPGPPEYPGIGCTNFAIYNDSPFFGVTCHHMNPKVDTGKLIAVRRFPLYKTDTVFTLTQRCYVYILQLFYEIISLILDKKELPELDEHWKRKPYTRKELNELCEITMDMPLEEIQHRIRAVTYPGAPGAFIKIDSMKFSYDTGCFFS